MEKYTLINLCRRTFISNKTNYISRYTDYMATITFTQQSGMHCRERATRAQHSTETLLIILEEVIYNVFHEAGCKEIKMPPTNSGRSICRKCPVNLLEGGGKHELPPFSLLQMERWMWPFTELYGGGYILTVWQIPNLGITGSRINSNPLTHHWSVGGQDFSIVFFLLVGVPKVTISCSHQAITFPK